MGHILAYMITAQTRSAHRARWWVWGWNPATGEHYKMPHQANMRGTGAGVGGAAGWESRTGGATRGSVEDALWDHRFAAQCEQEGKD
jgi:hypothetical protein